VSDQVEIEGARRVGLAAPAAEVALDPQKHSKNLSWTQVGFNDHNAV